MSDNLPPLEGFIDAVDRDQVRGWAYDGSDAGVRLQVFGNDALLGVVVADEYRGDLGSVGNGHHAFSFTIAGGLPAGRTAVSVRREADAALLGNSPFAVEYDFEPAVPVEPELEPEPEPEPEPELEPESAPEAPVTADEWTPVVGNIDSVDTDGIRGWARDGSGAHVRLRVSSNGHLLGVVSADIYREDLARSGVGDGHHAFAFTFANGPPPGRVAITVARESDGAEIGNSPFNIEFDDASDAQAAIEPEEVLEPVPGAPVSSGGWTPVEGNIDSVDTRGIRGWARDGSNAHVRLRVSSGAQVLGVVTANIYREDLMQNGIGDGCYAFAFAFADGPPAGQVAIRVVRESDGAEIGNSPFNIEFPQPAQSAPLRAASAFGQIASAAAAPAPKLEELKGRIEVVGRDLVRGWAFDVPGQPVNLAIFANDVPLGRVIADGHREDIEARGFGDGRHGFVFTIPGGLPPGRIAITVKRAQDQASLGNSPFYVDFD